ncbi:MULTISPECIES: class I SAM-dependent methyltransferase [unclassified Paenibacillus]|uniref:class I SAM-dependent methyltransferase n=1 Tax=unclassified Paenibacillus TaxID=185978 RepID=UPI000CFC16BA|nr:MULTISPECIES: class I SAM-dependent methyltransferase [unclassified Paenibacillus]PRA07607.1 SAM-dependent methyltransferase [Paenibacillus sp. MYb63]PRA51252.1 SAM-dependent methyltransferase [Paenibacillus sp. MYb67]QZN74377.1 class I SAM-dependent methyltransferase [Paenibacillus sp. DR312]
MNSEERFTSRVDSYLKYRPSYPKEAINHLYDVVGLDANSNIADIGSGTGIISKLLLERGSYVIAVEPNQAMREAAEQTLKSSPQFQSIAGSAESTGLPDQSVDFIVCAQAFHWFDRSAAQIEFRRILRPGGRVILIWNSRLTHGTPFREEYNQLLHTYGTDYNKVNHKNISQTMLLSFFKEGSMHEMRFRMSQKFNFEGLKGRLLSSSYSPAPGHANYDPMMSELRNLFDKNNQEGIVAFDYETEIFWGEV